MATIFNKSKARVFTVKDGKEAVRIMPGRTVELSDKLAEDLDKRYRELELIKTGKSKATPKPSEGDKG